MKSYNASVQVMSTHITLFCNKFVGTLFQYTLRLYFRVAKIKTVTERTYNTKKRRLELCISDFVVRINRYLHNKNKATPSLHAQ